CYTCLFFSQSYAHHPDLHSFPTRRSSDLIIINDWCLSRKKPQLSILKALSESLSSQKRPGENSIFSSINVSSKTHTSITPLWGLTTSCYRSTISPCMYSL